MHAGQPLIEQMPQVAAQQVPREVVRFLAVLAVDDKSTDTPGLEQCLEDFEIFEVRDDVLALLRSERLEVVGVVLETRRRVARVVGEGVERRVVAHVPTVVLVLA